MQLTILSLALIAITVSARPLIIPRSEVADSYDYIIVGGGTSGLVLGSRLSADPAVSVLVIEAGRVLDETEPPTVDIQFPRYSGWNTGQKYHWNTSWAPIDALEVNKVGNLPLAKVAGGGSAINGMFLDRGSQADYDLWESLGNPGWGWEGLLPYFKKSETFHPPSNETWAKEFGISWDLDIRGDSGPVQVSYPPWLYPQTNAYWGACEQMGIGFPKDGASGDALGCFMTANAMDPKTMTRSYAKTAYHNIARERDNYHLVQEHEVTKVLFNNDKNPRALGVEYASGPEDEAVEAKANKEVIMAAGTVHTVRVLQLSGVGDKRLMEQLGIPLIVDLPGVGANFQDHAAYFMRNNVSLPPEDNPARLNTDTVYDAEMKALFLANRTGPWAISQGNGAGFFPLPQISSRSNSILSTALTQDSGDFADASIHSTVLAGHSAQRDLLLQKFAQNDTAVLEVIFPPRMESTFVLGKPLSRGRVVINSTSPWEHPVIYMRTFTDPLDIEIMVEGLKYTREIWSQPSLQAYNPIETNPGASIQTDEDIRNVLKMNTVPSIAHPSCSCPMMPRKLGGCVDSRLKVYGVEGLRIVDASVMPLIPTTHLTTTVYAVAEKAADVIKADY